MARLEATKVLPSPEVEEVNMMTFSSFSNINCILVRMERKISSIWLFIFSCTTISPLVLAVSDDTAMSAMIGSVVSLATSSCPSIL